jgi:hypothetical protein
MLMLNARPARDMVEVEDLVDKDIGVAMQVVDDGGVDRGNVFEWTKTR